MSNLAPKRTLWLVLAVSATLGVSAIVQAIVGAFPLSIVRFPLNVILMALWLVLLVELYRRRDRSKVAQLLLSQAATVISLVLMAAVGIVLGLQREPASTAWPTVVAVLFVLSHLTLVTLRGWRNATGVRWRFVVNHAGLWLALVAGFWGAPDREQVRAMVTREVPTREAYDMSGRTTTLDCELQLVDFKIDYYTEGQPSMFEATVAVDGESATLQVNHPHHRTWSEMIYLVSYDVESPDRARYCVVEVVREPWRWLSVVGIVMLIAGAVLMFARGPRKEGVR
ncbi:MAG: cytochrome c biogenesis protein ResB [Rikenellaceae bacterium]|nr:cytochrome c biogenesis protein ResB [Rikenellaceae bacterium]